MLLKYDVERSGVESMRYGVELSNKIACYPRFLLPHRAMITTGASLDAERPTLLLGYPWILVCSGISTVQIPGWTVCICRRVWEPSQSTLVPLSHRYTSIPNSSAILSAKALFKNCSRASVLTFYTLLACTIKK